MTRRLAKRRLTRKQRVRKLDRKPHRLHLEKLEERVVLDGAGLDDLFRLPVPNEAFASGLTGGGTTGTEGDQPLAVVADRELANSHGCLS